MLDKIFYSVVIMEAMNSLGHVPKEKWNFLKLAECLALVACTLKKYTETIVTQEHIRIREKFTGQPTCRNKCSLRLVKHDMWCDTCKNWKHELLSLVRHKDKLKTITWRKLKSWKWPEEPLWIVPIFLNNNHVKDISEIDLTDLTTALCIWDNCKVYRISQNVINKLRKNRNKYFGHNSKVKVTDIKMKNVCCVINTMFAELCRDSSVPEHIKNEIYEGQRELCEIEARKSYEELVLEKIEDILSHTKNCLCYSVFATLKRIQEYWFAISIVLF